MDSILKDAKLSIQALKNADNETLTGTGVDMTGFNSVAFVVGALKGEALDFAIKAQQDTDAAYGTAADLVGTSITVPTTIGDDGLAVLEIHEPRERYVRPIITVPNANAATATFCLAIQFNGIDHPQTNSGELHVSPAEGTA